MDIGDIFSGIILLFVEEIIAGAFDFYVLLPYLLHAMNTAGGPYSSEIDLILWTIFVIVLIFPIIYHIIKDIRK
jgi:hypothetical protein